jgi:hypothetical protein
MSRMYWNSRDQMHFLGLEYCKKKFSKKSFRNLKKGHWILVIVQLLGLMWQLVRSCAEPRRFVFVLQTAICWATRRQTETTPSTVLKSHRRPGLNYFRCCMLICMKFLILSYILWYCLASHSFNHNAVNRIRTCASQNLKPVKSLMLNWPGYQEFIIRLVIN